MGSTSSSFAFTLIAFAAILGCSGERDVTAAEAGLLARFDAPALHADATEVPPGDATAKNARCTFTWPDDADEGFEVLVEADYVGSGAVLSTVSVTTLESDCSLEVNVESPARYLEVGGVNETQATLRLSYVCPSGEGSAGVTVSSSDGVEFGGTGSCTPAP